MNQPINSSKTLLASQPIYTVKKDLFGFELFFRHETNLSAQEFGDDLATSEVLLNLCTGITEQFDLYARPMFINLSERFLLSDTFLPLPPHGVVIELPSTIQGSGDVVKAIKNKKAQGFSFALDGFTFDRRVKSLLPLVDYLKVDVLSQSGENLARKMADFTTKQVAWVAQRVETEEQFLSYSELGFSLFQGYFLARPLEVQGYSIRGKINNSIETINAVSQPDIEIEELARIVSKDPHLATQILKVINSPACAIKRSISSLKEGMVYLGLAQVRKWAIMMSMLNSSVSSSGTVRMVLTRAKACENLAMTSIFTNPDQAFLVGLLSGVQLLFGVKNDVFLKQVALHPDIEKAVLKHHGFLGQILAEIIKTEHSVMQHRNDIFDNDPKVLLSYHQASDWSEQALSSFANSSDSKG